MHRNRRYWSVARIYCFAVGALWLLGPALLIANIIDHGADHHTLMPAVGIGGTFLLGMLMVALKFWPRPLDPPERPYRRPAMVGGRPFGEGLDVAVGRVRTERAPTPRVPFLPDSPTAMLPPVVGPSALRTAPLPGAVAVAEPEEFDEPEITLPGLEGYLAGTAGEPAGPPPEDRNMRGWVAGTLERERGRDDEDAE